MATAEESEALRKKLCIPKIGILIIGNFPSEYLPVPDLRSKTRLNLSPSIHQLQLTCSKSQNLWEEGASLGHSDA